MKVAAELSHHEVDALISHWAGLAIANATQRHGLAWASTKAVSARLGELAAMKDLIQTYWDAERAAAAETAVDAQ